MKIGCIIQARMTSRRFPGKSVAIINEHPVIAHVVEGVLGCEVLDKVIVAVPNNVSQRPISKVLEEYFDVSYIPEEPADVYLYSPDVGENDVLARYFYTAKEFKLSHIIRVTGDCPFIQPEPIQDVITELLRDPTRDYVSNVHPRRTLPKGLDVEGFTFGALSKAHYDVTSYYDREHVTPYMQRTMKIKNIVYDIDRSDVNLCVDVPEDIQRLEQGIESKALVRAQ